ncbi:MAG TPA: hypothetical protein VMQ44_03335 [Candidatus Saccharimonadales bacterium]|nr:hypothetical protein [Candidatus Saccharimonadales bacterium]
MLTTPHATTGAVIAVLIPIPIVAIPLAIASHYVLDTIPHWQEVLGPDYRPTKWTCLRLPVDIVLALSLVYWAATLHPNTALVIWLSAIAANLPDLDSLVPLLPIFLKNKIVKKYWDWHCRIQNETPKPYGIITQFAFVLIGLTLVYLVR